MSLLDDYTRVSRRRPCPVCERGDWCLASRDNEIDPSRVICARVESRQRFGSAGWLHVLRDDGKRWNGMHRLKVPIREPEPDPKLALLAERAALQERHVERLAADLGVSIDSLARLGVGWTGRDWSFPMVDALGRVVGIALRSRDGAKHAVKGSHLGLFVPSGLARGERLLVCEGQTDTAACLDLGFHAIGRPGARSTLRLACAIVQHLRPSEVVVVGDRDDVGTSGAGEVSSALAVTHAVRVIFPPDGVKDAREWKRRGATFSDVIAAIAAAPRVVLGVCVRTGGRR
jgi:hypothetical protein